jgi:AraC family transcriptional regulator
MQSEHSREEYESRMHLVVAYIDSHLDEPLDLIKLSEVAFFSQFHFHRLFSAWMGETIGDYLRRRRLEVAAMRLVAQPRTRILNIALSVGFGSSEAFTRAFNNRFGCSPSSWRKTQHSVRKENSNLNQVNSNFSQVLSKPLVQNEISNNQNKENLMKISIIERQPVTIAYLRHHGPYGEPIARFWQEVYVPWAIMNRLGANHARFGISHDDPSITSPEQCRYDACAEVSNDFVVTGKAHKTTIPGGKYAALKFKGTVEKIGDAWTSILRDWLPSSGFQLDARPAFEYYPKDAAFDFNTGEFECEICIPVALL